MRPTHRFPRSAVGIEVIAWKCEDCGVWVKEYRPDEAGPCPGPQRATGADQTPE